MGSFLPAFKDSVGFENERHTICIENDRTSVLVTQIAGLLARRIVSWTDLDSELERGQLYGMIKFGSCTELYMDKNVEYSWKKVNILQVVTLLSGGCVMNKSIIPNLFTSANLAFGVLGYHILCHREYLLCCYLRTIILMLLMV